MKINVRSILPKTLVATGSEHVFFLAGPVRGGEDWQKECCRKIGEFLPDSYVVIPYYHKTLPSDHPLVTTREKGDENHFPRQLNWERHYLDLASKRGCVIFWLPTESKTDPRPGGGYATDTRGEIGEWRGRLMADPNLKVVVGGEEEFPGFDQIRRNFWLAVNRNFRIYQTLETTVSAAVRMALR